MRPTQAFIAQCPIDIQQQPALILPEMHIVAQQQNGGSVNSDTAIPKSVRDFIRGQQIRVQKRRLDAIWAFGQLKR